jgi:CheY-like chemotaxis protein
MTPLISLELTRRLKAGGVRDRDLPVILMSSAGRVAADGAGADASIDKPFELEVVKKLVARAGFAQQRDD